MTSSWRPPIQIGHDPRFQGWAVDRLPAGAAATGSRIRAKQKWHDGDTAAQRWRLRLDGRFVADHSSTKLHLHVAVISSTKERTFAESSRVVG